MPGGNNNNNNGAKPKGGSSGKADCKICDNRVGKNDKGINCDMFNWWYHAKCLRMGEATYDIYSNETIHWVCKMCVKSRKEENEVLELIGGMIEMNKMEKEKNESERAQIMEMLKKMSDQIDGLEKIVEAKISEKVKNVEKVILAKVNEDIEQKLEKFKRRKNIVIYGLPEGKGKDDKERGKSDNESITELIGELDIDLEVPKFRVIRLGKQIAINKARPVKVELEVEGDKYKFLKKAAEIRKTHVEKFKKIIISVDLTLKQRELDKILWEELKMRRDAGERNIKIKDGRIVQSTDEGAGSRK